MSTSLESLDTSPGGRTKIRALIKPLPEVLACANDAVVERYQKDFGISRDDAMALFSDMKRFLWLAAVEGVVAPPPKIDDAWHTFIIFTADYHEFCWRYFGRFMHHRPQRPSDKPDGGKAVRRAIESVKLHFGGFEALSDNWRFPSMRDCWGGSCSSNSVSCSPTPSCDSSVTMADRRY